MSVKSVLYPPILHSLKSLCFLRPTEYIWVYARNPQLGELDLNDSMGDIKVEVWKTDLTISSKDGIMDITFPHVKLD